MFLFYFKKLREAKNKIIEIKCLKITLGFPSWKEKKFIFLTCWGIISRHSADARSVLGLTRNISGQGRNVLIMLVCHSMYSPSQLSQTCGKSASYKVNTVTGGFLPVDSGDLS